MLSDWELWECFLSGDAESFKSIYERSVSDLYTYGERFSHDKELVKDCVHDLFVELHRKRSSLGKTDKIMPYLMVSLKRIILKKLRNEKTGSFLSIDKLPFALELPEDEKEATDENNTDALQVALNKLTNRQREAIYLKYVLGFDYEELTKVLDLNYQASRNLIYRAILKLRKNLYDKIIIFFSVFQKTV